MSQIIQLILDMLGMTKREQVVTFAGLTILIFALYAGKQFATQKVYSTLYLLLALCFCVFMTTDNERTRFATGIGACAVVGALFAWYFLTKRLRVQSEDR